MRRFVIGVKLSMEYTRYDIVKIAFAHFKITYLVFDMGYWSSNAFYDILFRLRLHFYNGLGLHSETVSPYGSYQ